MSESGKHVIPVLSSSPPPMGEAFSFDEGAEDDDFGSFAAGVPGLIDPDSPKVTTWNSREYHRSDTLPSGDQLTSDPVTDGFAPFQANFPPPTGVNCPQNGDQWADPSAFTNPGIGEMSDSAHSEDTPTPIPMPSLSDQASVESLDLRKPQRDEILPNGENGQSWEMPSGRCEQGSMAAFSSETTLPTEDGEEDSDFGDFNSVTPAFHTETISVPNSLGSDLNQTESQTAATLDGTCSDQLAHDPTDSTDCIDPSLADLTNSINPIDPGPAESFAAFGKQDFCSSELPPADNVAINGNEAGGNADFLMECNGDNSSHSLGKPDGSSGPSSTFATSETQGQESPAPASESNVKECDNDFADIAPASEKPFSLPTSRLDESDALEGDNDDDDFADFAQASEQPFSLPSSRLDQPAEDEMDDFADFSQASDQPLTLTMPTAFAGDSGEDVNSGNHPSNDPSDTGDSTYESSQAEEDSSTSETVLGALDPALKPDGDPEMSQLPSLPTNQFDDFSGFSSAPRVESPNKMAAAPEPDREMDPPAAGAKFSDFTDFRQPVAEASADEEDDFGEFADFSSGPPTDRGITGVSQAPEGAAQDESGDPGLEDSFGNFGGATSFGGSLPTIQQSRTESASERVEQVFEICFPLKPGANLEEVAIDLLSDLIARDLPPPDKPATRTQNTKTKSKKPESFSVELNLWKSLKDLKKTNALSYQWTGSHNDKRLLSSLGVDSRNILPAKKSSVPIFAAHLTLLQPSKIGEKDEKVAAVVAEEEPAGHTQTHTEKPEQENLPQIEFDWTGSGLINPLDANILNLDFFAAEKRTSQPSSSKSAKKGLDNELLDLEMDSAPTPPPPTRGGKMASLLERIDNLSTTPKPPTRRDPHLSPEASRVLDSLPSLSFMQSPVLMFPIRSPTEQTSPQ